MLNHRIVNASTPGYKQRTLNSLFLRGFPKGSRLRIIALIPGTIIDEQRLLRQYQHLRAEGPFCSVEWFRREPELLDLIGGSPLRLADIPKTKWAYPGRVHTYNCGQTNRKDVLGSTCQAGCACWCHRPRKATKEIAPMTIDQKALDFANRTLEHLSGCTCPKCRELSEDIQAAIEDWQAAQVEATR